MATECVETQEWIEEEVWKPVDEWVEKTQEKCKKRRWYDPRRWLLLACHYPGESRRLACRGCQQVGRQDGL
jgi:hypothetical protein